MDSSYLKPRPPCRVRYANLKRARQREKGAGFLARISVLPARGSAMVTMPAVDCLAAGPPGYRMRRRWWRGGLILAWLWMAPLHAQVAAHILLQDSPLAGFQYHAGTSLWPQMRVGDALTLVREPANVHDARAVRVEWQGRKIGYVPRRENTDVARFMDRGEPLVARISRLAELRDPWLRVRFEILVPVQPAEGSPP